jgi:uncharacterized membrane protein YdjX (TVP38/TMEM64 family)
MEIVIITMLIVFIDIIVGAAVLAFLDTKDEVYSKWLRNDPTCGIMSFFILLLWPIL